MKRSGGVSRVTTIANVLALSALVIVAPLESAAITTDAAVALAASRAAEELGASVGDIELAGPRDQLLELDGREYLSTTWVHRGTGEQVFVAIDSRNSRSFNAFEFAELTEAWTATRDKFSPDARLKVDEGSEAELLAFVLTRPDYRPAVDAFIGSHPETTWSGDVPGTSDVDEEDSLRLGILKTKAAVLAEHRSDFVVTAVRMGASVVVAFDLVPMVYLRAKPQVAVDLAARTDVGEVLVPGRFDLAMDIAKPAVGADNTESRGFDGSGIELGVVEYARINWAHSGLTTVPHISRYVNAAGTGCLNGQMGGSPDTIGHMSWVTAVAASRAGGLPGIANDVTVIESSAASDDDLANSDARILKAAECAVLGTADVLNLSLVQNEPANFTTSDRFFDELVDEQHVTVVAAAGDHGPADGAPTNPDHCPGDHKVRSPASAWNVVAVGGYNDGDQLGSANDELWWRTDNSGPAYCWQEPAAMPGETNDREKPELSAPAVTLRTSTGHVISGTSGSSPIVAAIVATMMENDLALTVEPERVRAMLVASSKVDRTPRPDGAFNQDQEGWGSANARWSNLIADQSTNGRNGRKTFNGVDSGVPSCPFSKPASQTVAFTGAADRFIRFVVTWNSHNIAGVDTRASDYNISIKDPFGTVIGTSSRVASNYEVVDFFVDDSGGAGTYTAVISPVRWGCSLASERLGWAFVSF